MTQTTLSISFNTESCGEFILFVTKIPRCYTALQNAPSCSHRNVSVTSFKVKPLCEHSRTIGTYPDCSSYKYEFWSCSMTGKRSRDNLDYKDAYKTFKTFHRSGGGLCSDFGSI